MKYSRVSTAGAWALALSVMLPSVGHCANWFISDGTEPQGAPAVRIFGLVQPTYQYDASDKVPISEGGPEEYPLLSSIAPDYASTSSFYLFRVRLGSRGAVNDLINYEVVAEYGANALTHQQGRETNVELAEGSITLNHVPGMRVRVGLFKVPGSEEGLRTVIDYVNFTLPTQLLINSQPLELATGTPVDGAISARSRSGVRAFRDTGVEAFDAFTYGNKEVSYAVMVGNGDTLNDTDQNNEKSLYGRVQASYLFDQSTHHYVKTRPDMTVFAWMHDEHPGFEDEVYDQRKWGAGFTYARGRSQFTAEYMYSEGMLFLPAVFPSASGLLFTDTDNKATGWYADAGYFVTENVLINARYDQLSQDPERADFDRQMNTLTLGAVYYFSPSAWVSVNYESRSYDYGKRAAGEYGFQVAQAEDATSDRCAVQLTLKF